MSNTLTLTTGTTVPAIKDILERHHTYSPVLPHEAASLTVSVLDDACGRLVLNESPASSSLLGSINVLLAGGYELGFANRCVTGDDSQVIATLLERIADSIDEASDHLCEYGTGSTQWQAALSETCGDIDALRHIAQDIRELEEFDRHDIRVLEDIRRSISGSINEFLLDALLTGTAITG